MRQKKFVASYSKFVNLVVDGTLKAGNTFTQSQLCELLEISISPLREKLVLLEEFGLVKIKPRSGIQIVYPDVKFMRENMQFRILIEMNALALFAETVSSDWIEEMRRNHVKFRKIFEAGGDIENHKFEYIKLDGKFHRDIVDVLENETISNAHELMQDKLRMARRVHGRIHLKQVFIHAIDEHLLVIDALEKREFAETKSALESHFRSSTYRTIIGS